MAQWKETLEPYIKVHEEIKTTTLNPTAGEDLIIGVTLISDAGPATPTLITNQSEFIKTYASQDITKDYIESLNELYLGADKITAATMWCNGYRLAGSNTLLVVRASKANDLYFSKPLTSSSTDSMFTYVLRDGELLKRIDSGFKMVIDNRLDSANIEAGSGWSISINGVGVLGNRTDDDGAQYDYFVNNLPDLVDVLNDTSKFFSPSYKFYSDVKGTEENEVLIDTDSSDDEKNSVKSVIFDEVYLGVDILDLDDPRVVGTGRGMTYLITCEKNWTLGNKEQKIIDLNSGSFSGFIPAPYYATNVYNSATNLKVRIRRFNHDAVVNKELSDREKTTLTANGPSQYFVLEDVLDTFTKGGTVEPSENILYRDFYEVAVLDPSVNDIVSFFTIGNIMGRGDMEPVEVNNMLNMIQLNLPDNMHDLGLNYYRYTEDDWGWREAKESEYLKWYEATANEKAAVGTDYKAVDELPKNPEIYEASAPENIYRVPDVIDIKYYKYNSEAISEEKWEQLSEDPEDYTGATYNSLDEAKNVILNPTNGQTIKVDATTYKFYVYEYNGTATEFYAYNQDNSNPKWVVYTGDINPSNIYGTSYKNITDAPAAETLGDNIIVRVISDSIGTASTKSDLPPYNKEDEPEDHNNTVYKVTSDNKFYIFTKNGTNSMYVELAINPNDSDILKISDTDLKRALDQIALDEVYTTEGLSDLGNTEPSFQSYMANMAININYFYPISTLNSTNYMTIGNGATRISQDSYKLYMSSPWDIDTGTMGWRYYASPSVLYWEAVARNRRNNNEFASIIGQSNGIVQYQRPVVEFNKKSRQLLLSKRINTVLWNVSTQAWNMNDCYTKQNENNIMGEDGNSRLGIRICKAMPTLLRQFIGKKITEKLCEDVKAVIRYFFTTTILPMNYTVENYNIICNYDEALARQNKIKVIVQIRFSRSLKFIDVYAEYYDVGMEFEEPTR